MRSIMILLAALSAIAFPAVAAAECFYDDMDGTTNCTERPPLVVVPPRPSVTIHETVIAPQPRPSCPRNMRLVTDHDTGQPVCARKFAPAVID